MLASLVSSVLLVAVARADDSPSTAPPAPGSPPTQAPSADPTPSAPAPAPDPSASGAAAPAPGTAAAAPAPSAPEVPLPSTEAPVGAEPVPPTVGPSPLALDLAPTNAGVAVGGFADVGFLGAKNFTANDFVVGQFVVHSLATMPGNFSAFAEISVNSSPAWETRLERVQLAWEQGDALKITAGRHHIPVTWWNSTFHHGLWLQTTARRPMMIGYNDAFIPNHAVGVVASGRAPFADALGLRYEAGLTGGGDDHKHSGAVTEAPRLAWTGGLSIEPRAIPHLRVGTVTYTDPKRQRGDSTVRETLTGVHVAYTSEQPELIAEWVVVDHDVLAGHAAGADHDALVADHYSYGGYVQVAWRLPVGERRAKPYARSERMLVDGDDPSLAASVSQDLHTVGLRYDLSDTFALKTEGAYRMPDAADATFEGLVQLSAAW
jgi:hypothetical protein